MNREKKSVTVFSQDLCARLMLKGHRLQGMAADRRYPERNVFFFRNDPLVLAGIAGVAPNKLGE